MISSRLHHLVNVIHNTGRPQVPVFHLLQAQNRASTPNQTPKSAFFQHTNNKSTTTQQLKQHANTTNLHNPNRADSQPNKKKNQITKPELRRDPHTACMTTNKNAQIFSKLEETQIPSLEGDAKRRREAKTPPSPKRRHRRKRIRTQRRTTPMRRLLKLGAAVESPAASVASAVTVAGGGEEWWRRRRSI